jgi:hypothetical protein
MTSEPIKGACCYKVTGYCCRDGTAGTPYSGYGRSCNIFGCACKGPLGRIVTTKVLSPSVDQFLDNISVVEDHLNWEVAYLVGETMHKINNEF